MARMKRIAASEQYKQHLAAASEIGEDNDCVVRALSVASGLPYMTIHAALAKQGRKFRHGCYMEDAIAAMSTLGWTLRRDYAMIEKIMRRYPPREWRLLRGITTRHPARFARAWAEVPTVILQSSGHVACFRDGELHDWARNRARQVIAIWVLEPTVLEPTA